MVFHKHDVGYCSKMGALSWQGNILFPVPNAAFNQDYVSNFIKCPLSIYSELNFFPPFVGHFVLRDFSILK